MYDLLIVCPREFQSACVEYANFKMSTGVRCLVYPYEGGHDLLARDPQFLRELRITPAQLAEPATCLKADIARHYLAGRVRHVLLAGDADKIPVPWIEFVQGPNRFFYPSDLYYADLFKVVPGPRSTARKLQTWDPDRDGVKGEFRADQISAIDWYPNLVVGRIPASSSVELERAFHRLMSRTLKAPRCLVLRGNDEQQLPWLEQEAAQAAQALTAHGYAVTKLSIAPDASQSEARCTLDRLHATLAEGVTFLFWFGHGGHGVWGSFGPYTISFVDEISRLSEPPVVFSTSCEVGAYTLGVYDTRYFSGGVLTQAVPFGSGGVPAVPDALQPAPSTINADFSPEQWIVKYDRGAAALIAGHSWGSLGDEHLGTQALDFIGVLPRGRKRIGDCFNSMLLNYLRRYKEELPTSGVALNHLLRIHLFGDPTTPLY